jgi:phenylalanyl-tRNA synthetase beta chain
METDPSGHGDAVFPAETDRSHRGGAVLPAETDRSHRGGAVLPAETEIVGVVVAGPTAEAADAVRLLRRLEAALHVEDLRLVAAAPDGFHATRTAKVVIGGRPAGHVGEIDPLVLSAWGIPGRVACIEVELAPLVAGYARARPARAVSRFPSADVDLAFTVGYDVSADDIRLTLLSSGGELVEKVELFDVYRGPALPAGTRSLAFRLRYVAQDRTLTDAEIASLRSAAIEAVTANHEVTLRS